MALALKVKVTRRNEYWINPNLIRTDPELNGRTDLPGVEWLIDSIMLMGQLQPCGIRNVGGIPTLAYGHSRWRAVTEINQRKKVPGGLELRCVAVDGNPCDGFLAAIHENYIRNAPTQLDEAGNILRLRRFGKTDEEIADVFHKDVRWVRDRALLMNATPEVQEAVRSGKVKPTAAKVIAKMSEEAQRQAVKEGVMPPAAPKVASASRPVLRAVVKAIADGGMAPFAVASEDGAPEFCQKLLMYVEGK